MDDERYEKARSKVMSANRRITRARQTELSARDNRDEAIVEMVDAGGSLGQVARDTQCSKSLVVSVVRERRIARRLADRADEQKQSE